MADVHGPRSQINDARSETRTMTDNNMSEIQMHNTPDHHGVKVEQIGTEPRITYHVDWEDMGQPSPKLFQDLGDVQVKLATRGDYIVTDDVQSAYDEAMEAINTLIRTMVECRADELDGENAKHNLYMGNLEELPEVEKEVEQVRASSGEP